MAVPNQINDGDWNLLQRSEGGDFEFPFSDRGDFQTFQQRLHYKIDRNAYMARGHRQPMSVIRTELGIAYLTKLGKPRDCGCNLVEWEDEISSLPATRIEPGTFAYTYQWWRAATSSNVNPAKYFYDVNFDIEEQTFTVLAHFKYEYFLNAEPQPLIKPRVFLRFGILQSIGGTPILGNELVAEDSQVSIYACRIYERRTAFVKVNSAGNLVA